MTSPRKYLKEVGHQAKKVRWPSFKSFLNAFIIVIVIVTIAALVLMIENWAAGSLINAASNLFGGAVSATTSA